MTSDKKYFWIFCGYLAFSANLLAAETVQNQETAKISSPKIERVHDKDKPERVQKAVTLVKNQLSQVLQNMKRAKEERDMIKLNCINEKLNALKGLLRVCEQAETTMQEFFANHNNEAATHEYTKVMMIENKSKQLASAAASCIGEMTVYSGETQVEISGDEVSNTDPTRREMTYTPVTQLPAASPYQ